MLDKYANGPSKSPNEKKSDSDAIRMTFWMTKTGKKENVRIDIKKLAVGAGTPKDGNPPNNIQEDCNGNQKKKEFQGEMRISV